MGDLSKKIKLKRIEMDLSQDDLAKKSNVSRSSIIKLEKGDNSVSLGIKYKICKFLDISTNNSKNNKIKEPQSEYIYNDQTSEGFKEFQNDEDIKILMRPTEEEIEWLKKNVIFFPEDKPTKQTYIDLLKIYRKVKIKK